MENATNYRQIIETLGRELAKEDIFERKYYHAEQRLLQLKSNRDTLQIKPNRPTQECGRGNANDVNDDRDVLGSTMAKNYGLIIDTLGRELAKEDILERKCYHARQRLLQFRSNREMPQIKPNRPTQESGQENANDVVPENEKANADRKCKGVYKIKCKDDQPNRLGRLGMTKAQRWMRAHRECFEKRPTYPLGNVQAGGIV